MAERFFGKTGKMFVRHAGPDDGGYPDNGYDEYSTPAPSDDHRWVGAAWIFDVAAGRASAVVRIKNIRKIALDRCAPSPGISDVYNENLAAAKAYLGGTGASTVMRDGSTATTYCTAKGSKMGYTADQFANYIVTENQRVAALASQVEEEYLRVAYTYLPAKTDAALIAAAVTDYQTYCDARKP